MDLILGELTYLKLDPMRELVVLKLHDLQICQLRRLHLVGSPDILASQDIQISQLRTLQNSSDVVLEKLVHFEPDLIGELVIL